MKNIHKTYVNIGLGVFSVATLLAALTGANDTIFWGIAIMANIYWCTWAIIKTIENNNRHE